MFESEGRGSLGVIRCLYQQPSGLQCPGRHAVEVKEEDGQRQRRHHDDSNQQSIGYASRHVAIYVAKLGVGGSE